MTGQRKTDKFGWKLVSIIIPLLFVVGGFVVMVKIMEYRVGEIEEKLDEIKGNPHGVDVQKVVAQEIEKYQILYDEKFKQNDTRHRETRDELKEIKKAVYNLQLKMFNSYRRRTR